MMGLPQMKIEAAPLFFFNCSINAVKNGKLLIIYW